MLRVMALALVASALVMSGASIAQTVPTTAITPSPDMTVAAFLARVDQLRTGGPEWTLSPEAGELFGAISAVGKAYRQTLADRLTAGQPVEACLPPEAEIESDVLFAHLAGYTPEAAARTTIREAFSQLVRQRFPCR
ncbi:hypothetical protein FHS52_001049 [Erythromicrobium ramosum]|jgi:hypothetical protein|uniref:Rap1a immunity protein domain-containing protein n=1 Tax=Erythrobacter ramosus TaxID=35811 RepID=A0A6I4UFJ7_9SPHN|nr:hypothetical protein [Erythrobacter ramosus]MBB3775106.1 hypothetical protein [Erythrobacter ramosus]MXP37266.1 hypothetical protein [Erythrobacter ramosus]